MPTREMTEEERSRIAEIEALEEQFKAKCQQIGGSRHLSLAITKIEEATMWVKKHITG